MSDQHEAGEAQSSDIAEPDSDTQANGNAIDVGQAHTASEADHHAEPVREPKYQVYPTRFYILGVFCLAAFDQNLVWITFSPIAQSAMQYYGIGVADVDLLLNLGAIAFIALLPACTYIVYRPNGLRVGMLICGVLVFFGCFLRLIPTWSPAAFPHAMQYLIAGQFVSGMSSTLFMVAPPLISAQWFAVRERNRATALIIQSYMFGVAAGFLIGPIVVSEPNDIPKLLYIHLALAAVPMVLSLLYFPAKPPTPASRTAKEDEICHDHTVNESEAKLFCGFRLSAAAQVFLADCKSVCLNGSFWLLITAGAASIATISTWLGILNTILAPLGYSEFQTGLLGFVPTLASMAGGLVVGAAADYRHWRKKLKFLVLLMLGLTTIMVLWFLLCLPSSFSDKPAIPNSSFGMMLVAITLAGTFGLGSTPLYYELAIELTYPANQLIPSSILALMINGGTMIELCIVPVMNDGAVNLATLCIMVLCFLIALVVKEEYNRRNRERASTSPDMPLQETQIKAQLNLSQTIV